MFRRIFRRRAQAGHRLLAGEWNEGGAEAREWRGRSTSAGDGSRAMTDDFQIKKRRLPDFDKAPDAPKSGKSFDEILADFLAIRATPEAREKDREAFKAKLLSRIEIVRGRLRTPCWEWQGSRNYDGYGDIYWNGRVFRTHRASYELHCEPIPEGMWILHSCHNPPCCNPQHLRIGTHLENIQDRMDRVWADRKKMDWIKLHHVAIEIEPSRIANVEKELRSLNVLEMAFRTGRRPPRWTTLKMQREEERQQ